MKYTLKLTLLLSFITIALYCQPALIKGKLYSYKTLLPVGTGIIQLGGNLNTSSNSETGEFEYKNSERHRIDTILIWDWDKRPLLIVGLPNDMDTLDLGMIPLFEQYYSGKMVDFFCGPLNIWCKFNEKRYRRQEDKKRLAVRRKVENIIKDCHFLWKGNVYKIESCDGISIINLSKSLGNGGINKFTAANN